MPGWGLEQPCGNGSTGIGAGRGCAPVMEGVPSPSKQGQHCGSQGWPGSPEIPGICQGKLSGFPRM